MDDAKIAGCLQTTCRLQHPFKGRALCRLAAFADGHGEIVSLDILHREIIVAGGLPSAVDFDDVRRIETGDSFGFQLKAAAEAFVVGQMRWQNLDRDIAIKALLPTTINGPHAAPTQQRANQEVAPYLSRQNIRLIARPATTAGGARCRNRRCRARLGARAGSRWCTRARPRTSPRQGRLGRRPRRCAWQSWLRWFVVTRHAACCGGIGAPLAAPGQGTEHHAAGQCCRAAIRASHVVLFAGTVDHPRHRGSVRALLRSWLCWRTRWYPRWS